MSAGEVRHFTSGRMALSAALTAAQIGAGDQVLLPAYHCIVMVDAALAAGAKPLFYRIQSNTCPDLRDIERRITPSTRAVVVTHYFGFPQPEMSAIRALCDAHHLTLIEDCAHALLGGTPQSGCGFGTFGDYVIASPWKFLPTMDGGCLMSRRGALQRVKLKSAGLRYQLKSAINICEFAFEHGRLKMLNVLRPIFRMKDRVRSADGTAGEITTGPPPDPNALSIDFDPVFMDKRASWAARWIIRCAAWNAIAERRRKHYRVLHAALKDLPGCAPLFPGLPPGVVPQVYPLLFDNPEEVFAELKTMGVPIIRFGEFLWDYMDRSLCPVSVDLSRRVFQFPCHQDLRPEELAWMISSVREVAIRVQGGKPANGPLETSRHL